MHSHFSWFPMAKGEQKKNGNAITKKYFFAIRCEMHSEFLFISNIVERIKIKRPHVLKEILFSFFFPLI